MSTPRPAQPPRVHPLIIAVKPIVDAVGATLVSPQQQERGDVPLVWDGETVVWDVTLAPAAEDERGFVKLAQAFDADSSWAPQRLNGTAATDTISIGGLEWDVYDLGDAGAKQNITYAIGTQAGDDYLLLYGSRSADSTGELAESLVPQIRDLSESS